MGRKERRAMERKQRKEEIRMTPQRIRELKENAAKEACKRVEEMQKERSQETTRMALDMLILFGMRYHRKKDHYGRKRLEDYYDGCRGMLEEFERGDLTLQQIRNELVEETGIQLSEV